jgi:hypothetical protein
MATTRCAGSQIYTHCTLHLFYDGRISNTLEYDMAQQQQRYHLFLFLFLFLFFMSPILCF